MSAASGGRPATGSIVWADPKTKTKPIGVRVTKANGRRKIVPFEPGTTADDARALAPVLAERARLAVDEGPSETVAKYAKRWCAWREDELRLESASRDRGVLGKYLGPIAFRPIDAVTRDEVELVRDALDARVRQGTIAWKTAINVWAVTSKMFRDACRSKRRDLRVRADNPCVDVEGPDRGSDRAKPFLWPAMFLAFVSDDRIPLAWRRLLALSTYLYVRPQEMAALEWEDVRIEEGVVLVHRAMAMHSTDHGRVKPTKTGTVRRVPIEPALRPLLEAMKREVQGKGRLVVMPTESRLPRMFRRYLRPALVRAGIEVGDLFTADATRMGIDWRRATRNTGITWRAIRGDSPAKMMRAAGHRDIKTTMRYVGEADSLGASFGDVFPPLPPELLSASNVSAGVSAFRRRQLQGSSGKQGDSVARG